MRGTDRPGTVVFTPLKTRRARRQVQLPPFALNRLRRHRRSQLERRTAIGSRWRDPVMSRASRSRWSVIAETVFPRTPDAFTRAFKRLARRVGMHPATRLHDVRHAVVTELDRRGVPRDRIGGPRPRLSRLHDRRLPARLAGGTVRVGLGPRGCAESSARWQSVGTGGVRAPPRTGTLPRSSRSARWGGQDSNLRPADYESVPAGSATRGADSD